MTFLCIALVCLLAYSLLRHMRRRKALRQLCQNIRARRSFLREDIAGVMGREWDELCEQINSLVQDNERLQKQRSGQLAQLEATLGSLKEAVLIVDSGNYVLLANQALQSIFPKAGHILKQRVELILHSREFLTFIEEVRQGKAEPQREIEFLDTPNSVWVEATGSLIPAIDGSGESWTLFVLHDITRQKQLENVRKDFVANVSHELRTPLSVIKGYIETLADGHRDMPEADRDTFIKTIQRHAERLHSLLEDLLTLSRLESNKPNLHRELVQPGVFVANFLDEFQKRPSCREHRIESVIDPVLPELLADPLKLSQVLENLLDNAIKYTPKGAVVQVAVRHHDAEVEFCVRDNGPGIPAADLPHLFERFYRVDKGRSRETGGTGLGLSIVKHIAQLHGGRAWVESQQGRGAAFFVSLPGK
jgi:two-component system phosphate regulon sensor histidine kinase PhoR